ncbi:arylamine N-acetyltransferase [Aurantimonas sp. VKM B-3413]|uniref:arylamine N-acetyltransferase family protein n=1 Tax=Aurantimonas sp. VKM B-3413 TaxID=2779401 RepID=UPI001E585333|nr:arylamine N-acetyltransferase [Aurantimonas sp. VKM B-3413]MCB8839726.1 arylamine N-acetyltransferase [Aurantimonas sp. VKM B-3413]
MTAATRSFPDTSISGFDHAAYLTRIGVEDPVAPTLPGLTRLMERHMAAIPFEAIDVLLGGVPDLAPSAVDLKLVTNRRGGYCFEHASLFRRMLEASGFAVETFLARVRLRTGFEGPVPPATHAVLVVSIDGESYLADVGFGGPMPNQPLRLLGDDPQETRGGVFRIRALADGRVVERATGDAWLPLYEILPLRCHPADLTLANWFVATHPTSSFRNLLMAARLDGDVRYTLAGNRFSLRRSDGEFEVRHLTAGEVMETLADQFRLPVVAEWDAAIAPALGEW